MNLTLTKQQVLLLAAFIGLECDDLADVLPMDLLVTIVESPDGSMQASYWDDTDRAVATIPLGYRGKLNG
jgi:hypothetical protein